MVVIGGGAEAAVFLLAAHDARLTCLFEDNPTCTRIENRMAAESLSADFEAFVVQLGVWFPTIALPAQLVVIDAGTLAGLTASCRIALMARLQDWTMPGGLHAVVGRPGSVAPETWLSLYPDWERVVHRELAAARSGRLARGCVDPAASPVGSGAGFDGVGQGVWFFFYREKKRERWGLTPQSPTLPRSPHSRRLGRLGATPSR